MHGYIELPTSLLLESSTPRVKPRLCCKPFIVDLSNRPIFLTLIVEVVEDTGDRHPNHKGQTNIEKRYMRFIPIHVI